MIGIVAFVVLGVALHGVHGDCLDELKKTNGRPTMPGAFVSKCNDDGTYQSMQCHEGYCFCVFTESGVEVLGTRVRFSQPKTCQITSCFKGRHEKMLLVKNSVMLGVRVPSCEDDGTFSKEQCHPSTGFCWCVDSDTGKAIGKPTRGHPGC